MGTALTIVLSFSGVIILGLGINLVTDLVKTIKENRTETDEKTENENENDN